MPEMAQDQLLHDLVSLTAGRSEKNLHELTSRTAGLPEMTQDQLLHRLVFLTAGRTETTVCRFLSDLISWKAGLPGTTKAQFLYELTSLEAGLPAGAELLFRSKLTLRRTGPLAGRDHPLLPARFTGRTSGTLSASRRHAPLSPSAGASFVAAGAASATGRPALVRPPLAISCRLAAVSDPLVLCPSRLEPPRRLPCLPRGTLLLDS